jgi:hypothetical protein
MCVRCQVLRLQGKEKFIFLFVCVVVVGECNSFIVGALFFFADFFVLCLWVWLLCCGSALAVSHTQDARL